MGRGVEGRGGGVGDCCQAVEVVRHRRWRRDEQTGCEGAHCGGIVAMQRTASDRTGCNGCREVAVLQYNMLGSQLSGSAIGRRGHRVWSRWRFADYVVSATGTWIVEGFAAEGVKNHRKEVVHGWFGSFLSIRSAHK